MTAEVTKLPGPVRLTPDMIVRYYLANIDRLDDILVFAVWKDSRKPMLSVNTDIGSAALAYAGALCLKLATADSTPKEKAPVEGA